MRMCGRSHYGAMSPIAVLFDPDHHRVGSYQVFDSCLAESGFFHPGDAIGAGVVEAAGGFNQHVQAHQQAKGVLGTASQALRIRSFFSSRFQSWRMCPIMMTSTLGRGSVKKLPAWNLTCEERPFDSTYSSKMGATSGRSKPAPAMCGFLSATCTMRSPWAVPQSAADLYLSQGNLEAMAMLAPRLMPVMARRKPLRRVGSA